MTRGCGYDYRLYQNIHTNSQIKKSEIMRQLDYLQVIFFVPDPWSSLSGNYLRLSSISWIVSKVSQFDVWEWTKCLYWALYSAPRGQQKYYNLLYNKIPAVASNNQHHKIMSSLNFHQEHYLFHDADNVLEVGQSCLTFIIYKSRRPYTEWNADLEQLSPACTEN